MKSKRFVKTTSLSMAVFVLLLAGAFSLGWIDLAKDYYTKYRVFQNIFLQILENYVEEVDPEVMLDSAIEGMISELDPHTQYLPPKSKEDFDDRMIGYEGIGISFLIINKKITVMTMVENGPSFKAGLQIGDRIVQINGESAIGIDRDEVPKKLKGPPNTQVKVGVEREGTDEILEYVITRKRVNVEAIDSAFMIDDETAYIKLDRFSNTTGAELRKALNNLKILGMKKLLFDLRWNGGGLINEAQEVVDCFLPKGKMVVYTRGRTSFSNKEYYTEVTSPFEKLPLIILVNEHSASASEIVSGAIQDWDRGLIIGQTTFGKGLAQTPIPQNDGSALLLTTSRYFTPSGRLIQRDFGHKSRASYYMEAVVDSLKERVKADPDRPEFHTANGRIVYGAGGINPDHEIEYVSTDSIFNEMPLTLKLFQNGYIFEFSKKYAERNKMKNKGLNHFIDTFSFSDTVLDEFLNYLDAIKYSYDKEEIVKERTGIEILMKRDISFQLWGSNGLQKYINSTDTQLLNALKYFPQAEEFVKKYYSE